MPANPRVGLILMRTDLCGGARVDELREMIDSDALALTRQLSSWFDLVGPWVISSGETLQDCQSALRSEQIDLALLVYQTWTQPLELEALLDAVGSRPLVIWCYLPWRRIPRPASFSDLLRGSGTVGTFTALGLLKDRRIPYQFIYGAPEDARLMNELKKVGRAAQVLGALRGARFGLLSASPLRYPDLIQRLEDELGPTAVSIDGDELCRAVEQMPIERVEDYFDLIACPVQEVDEAVLTRSARAALGLQDLAVQYKLDLLAVSNDPGDITARLGLRPALYPDLTGDLPVLFQPETDIGAAAANFILHHLTGSPTMFVELWFWDEAKNNWLGGHSGLQNPALADAGRIKVVPDQHFTCPPGDLGAQFQFMARPGRITLFQLRPRPDGWQAFAISGVSLEDQPGVEGSPHVLLRLDAPISDIFYHAADIGVSQHWIMAYGGVLPELEALCSLAGIPIEIISHH